MAKANHKARPPKTERFVTIQEMWGSPKTMEPRPEKFYPYMKIGGMWLVNDAGFVPGRKAQITIESGRLIITQL
ncbi:MULTISPECIES: SymE family type I addiction module toxin [Burkholderia]|uniref:Type I addiction module toxin, SymE family n=1 Tax=Burkholderia contaminans TaxID=488447 RepID=A0A2S5E6D0_9BURK|nr:MULTISPECIES: SymE family type I addiction module toxin [Burkholderia]EKS9798640.1 type I addiction module toxin, SymE family [Burkholderia cepacia]EKS9802338.1 type I addiction module toxin, SymE family [Burkholderia cepacia]EKS9809652.1 type I addiction module toxin, SymE family [Burkholderia cepacia]EKS9822279.1 type I addiction module toxin, SymE family [Burkholderia cepacia]EKS9824222.1 type I addiction module toxin, SymE family [Burkholderia cepacia]